MLIVVHHTFKQLSGLAITYICYLCVVGWSEAPSPQSAITENHYHPLFTHPSQAHFFAFPTTRSFNYVQPLVSADQLRALSSLYSLYQRLSARRSPCDLVILPREPLGRDYLSTLIFDPLGLGLSSWLFWCCILWLQRSTFNWSTPKYQHMHRHNPNSLPLIWALTNFCQAASAPLEAGCLTGPFPREIILTSLLLLASHRTHESGSLNFHPNITFSSSAWHSTLHPHTLAASADYFPCQDETWFSPAGISSLKAGAHLPNLLPP